MAHKAQIVNNAMQDKFESNETKLEDDTLILRYEYKIPAKIRKVGIKKLEIPKGISVNGKFQSLEKLDIKQILIAIRNKLK